MRFFWDISGVMLWVCFIDLFNFGLFMVGIGEDGRCRVGIEFCR